MARPLKIFMRGKSITQLQEVLRRSGYSINDQKGLFGMDTRDAVKSIQKQQGLKPSGLVDEALMKLLQQGHPVIQEKEESSKDAQPDKGEVSQKQLDALVSLLVRKGVINEGELEAELALVVPTSL